MFTLKVDRMFCTSLTKTQQQETSLYNQSIYEIS